MFERSNSQWFLHPILPAVTEYKADGSVIVHINPSGGKSFAVQRLMADMLKRHRNPERKKS